MDQLQHNPDDTKHKTLVIRKTFDSSPSQVWNALTEEDALKSWWGPKGYTCPYYDLDLEKGGNYRFRALRSGGFRSTKLSSCTELE